MDRNGRKKIIFIRANRTVTLNGSFGTRPNSFWNLSNCTEPNRSLILFHRIKPNRTVVPSSSDRTDMNRTIQSIIARVECVHTENLITIFTSGLLLDLCTVFLAVFVESADLVITVVSTVMIVAISSAEELLHCRTLWIASVHGQTLQHFVK